MNALWSKDLHISNSFKVTLHFNIVVTLWSSWVAVAQLVQRFVTGCLV